MGDSRRQIGKLAVRYDKTELLITIAFGIAIINF
jgi:hypothetical protein